MKIKLLALLAIIAVACGSTFSQNSIPLMASMPDGNWNKCTGTPVGPHAVITAEHCEMNKGILAADGKNVTITRAMYDGNDHVIFVLSGIKFDKYSKIRQRELEVGEPVQLIGYPQGFKRLYRRGYIAGDLSVEDYKPPSAVKAKKVILLDAQVWIGDSGAAIFDQKGEVIGIVSGFRAVGSLKVAATYPLAFSDAELRLAVAP